MEMRGPNEARLLHVERGIEALDRDVRNLRQRAIAVAQGVWALWSDVPTTEPATVTATFSGTLGGCGGVNVVGVTINLSGGYGSVTTGSGGTFSGSISFPGTSVSVTFSTVATSQYQAYSHTFTLVAGSNALGTLAMTPIVTAAPTINTPANVGPLCASSGGTVSLTGITDGNGGAALPITVSATSSNTAGIPNPSVTYTSPNTTGTLTYTVLGATTCTIFVKVTNGGSTFCSGVTSFVTSFTITNHAAAAPTLNSILNNGPFTVGTANQTQSLTGIGPGGANPTGSLALSVVSSNPSVCAVVSTSYTNPNTTGSFVYSIVGSGSTTFSVTITDNNTGRCGATNTVTKTFTVSVI